MPRKETTLKEHVTRIGALGGAARAANMTDEERSESARSAALARSTSLTAERRKEIATAASKAAAAKRQEKANAK